MPGTDSTLVKVLDLKGLTSAHLRSDGTLNQKFILVFDGIYGEAPITTAQFVDKSSMVLGMADGSVIVYEKIPSKSLLENYQRLYSSVCAPVTKIIPQSDKSLLVVHCVNETSFEFVTWTWKNNRQYTCSQIFPTFLDLKLYTPIFDENGQVNKIAFMEKKNFYLNSRGREQLIYELDYCEDAVIKQVPDSNLLVLTHSNKILIFDHCKAELISSFTLTRDIKSIKCLHFIESHLNVLQLLVVSSSTILKLQIDIENNLMEQEQLKLDPMETASALDVFVTPNYFILVNSSGIYIYDTLSLRQVNKFTHQKFFLKPKSDKVKIESLEENKFLFVWDDSLAQIWDFTPRDKFMRNPKRPENLDIDKGVLGGKAIRKQSKYDISAGISEWTDEVREEEHLDSLRDRVNIEGLNEEELIAYAKLLSKGAEDESFENEEDTVDCIDDPELAMALKLSLIEM